MRWRAARLSPEAAFGRGLAPQPAAGSPLVLDLVIPRNGYEDDVLTKLNVVNFGTAEAGTDVERVQAWVDDGDGSFDGGDQLLVPAELAGGVDADVHERAFVLGR